MNSKNNKVLVWIISFNRQPYLKTCLETLFNNTEQKFDLIIYDNNSAEPTKKLLKNFENKLWSNGCTSHVIYYKENIGTTDVYYDVSLYRKEDQYLLKMDNDTKAPENKYWLNELINIIENRNYNLDVVALPTRYYNETLKLSKKDPIETEYGTVLTISNNVSPLSLYSPQFLKNLIFKKLDKNNFSYEPSNYHEERQIASYASKHGLNMGYLYKKTDEFLYFLQTSNNYEEFILYNEWKDNLKKTNKFNHFNIPKNKYAEDTTPLNINIEVINDIIR
jgi:glycosyltransferase involved in cell wall biosynthesis